MSNMNQCNFTGRMGSDLELKYSQQGMAIGNVSIAVSKKVKGEEKTTWVRLVFFDKGAELMDKYTSKGSMIRVSAEYQNRSYEQDGQTKYISEFIVRDFEFLGGRSQGQQNQGYQGGNQTYQQPQQQQGYGGGYQPQQNTGREYSSPPAEDD
jgi:single-strand DNA-binding protein